MLLLKTEMRMEPRELINFMAIAERLKCNTRHSWTSTYRHESVAEHSWRLTLLAYFVQDEFPEADMNKVIQMCILHDLGEAITGDIPAFYKTQKDEEVEDRKIEELFQTLPPFYRDKLLPLFREMGELATLEAKIYKALDKMEAIFQHNEADISTWIPLEYTTNLEYGAENVAFSPFLRRLKQELYNDSVRKIESVSEQGGGSNNRWVDLTLKVSPKMIKDAQGNENKAFTGHLGTHFDVMNKEFLLNYTERKAIVFDVSSISGRDIEVQDIDLSKVKPDMFVSFYSGYIERESYGSKAYFSEHPQLSDELIEKLLDRHISIIGIDFAGVRRGKEHTPKDQYCADKGVFIIENLCHLGQLLVGDEKSAEFIANTYPMNFAEMTGLPCRVIAKRK